MSRSTHSDNSYRLSAIGYRLSINEPNSRRPRRGLGTAARDTAIRRRRSPSVLPRWANAPPGLGSDPPDPPIRIRLHRGGPVEARLEDAVTIALAPLDYPDSTAWVQAFGNSLLALGNATSGAILLAGAIAQWRSIGVTTPTDGVCHQSHDESTEQFGVRGQGEPGDPIYWIRDDLAPDAGPNPAASPTRPRHALGIRVRTASGTVAALYVRRDARLGAFDRYVIAAFRAVAPAFQAGVNAWLSTNACRANVEGMLDSLGDPALLFDVDGTAVHANPAATQLGAQLPRLRDEAQRIAWAERRGGGHGLESGSVACSYQLPGSRFPGLHEGKEARCLVRQRASFLSPPYSDATFWSFWSFPAFFT